MTNFDYKYAKLIHYSKLHFYNTSHQQAKKKNHMILSIDLEKPFGKSQYQFKFFIKKTIK